MNAWAVLLGTAPPSDDFRHSCRWLQDRFAGVALVAKQHPAEREGLLCVAEPLRTGVVGRLSAGLQAMPGDVAHIVYLESASLDGLAQEAVSEMVQLMGPQDAAVVRGTPVTDALKRVHDSRIRGSVDRQGLYQITSPMVLRRDALDRARLRVPGSDELEPGGLLLEAGQTVRMLSSHHPAVPIALEPAGSIAR